MIPQGQLHSKITLSVLLAETNGEGPSSKFEKEVGQTDSPNGQKISGAADTASVPCQAVKTSQLRNDI